MKRSYTMSAQLLGRHRLRPASAAPLPLPNVHGQRYPPFALFRPAGILAIRVPIVGRVVLILSFSSGLATVTPNLDWWDFRGCLNCVNIQDKYKSNELSLSVTAMYGALCMVYGLVFD